MSSSNNGDRALRAALAALAPQLGIASTSLGRLLDRVQPYVGEDSFGGFMVTAGEHRGRDLAEFIATTVRTTDPEFFARPIAAAPKIKGDPKRMTATQRLAAANGDEGPKL